MNKRKLVASVLWSFMPVVCALRSLGHGVLWLALCGVRKIFRLKYDTGFASLVMLERAQLQSSLMCASFVVFRMRTAMLAIGYRRGATQTAQTPAPAQQRAQ